MCDPLSGSAVSEGGDGARAGGVVTVHYAGVAVPEGGGRAWVGLVVTVQYAGR